MPVTVKVNGTVNSLVHKGSNGISMATIPDVCKTPSPGGPVPIPYPNISQSATLAKGTTTVKADGMMIATKGSEFSLSNGDNAGVAGGVKSSTFMKESTWILYSFDVKMDGQNAARLTDKKFQNHENTADMGGVFQTPVAAFAFLQQAVDECNQDTSPTYEDGPKMGQKKPCTKLGSDKHACMEKKIADKNKEAQEDGKTGIEGECGYQRPPGSMDKLPFDRKTMFQNAVADGIKSAGPSATAAQVKAAVKAAIGKALGGSCFPDAAIVHPDGSKTFVDFKFPCPEGHPSGKGTSKGGKKTQMSPRQQQAYDRLGAQSGNGKAFAVTPRF
jgi:uncharacterized Zn-binding protein involved in type VI secretion